ncbi:MAG: hypothetical protein NTV61_10765 [Candidatus Bathyarchaeota archaeon]|nr:hypothetical protein [Candidatus Bathyarchaeota archaeon]
MVKLLDLEISTSQLTLRILTAITLSAVTLAALYYAPQVLINYTKMIPDATTQNIINQLIDPKTPTIGILTAAIVFLTITLRKTRIEGPSLICLGLSLLAYGYTLFHGGNLSLQIPVTEIQQSLGANIPLDIQAQLAINITTLMIASMITPILLLIKGALLTATRTVKTQHPTAQS